MSRQKLRNNLTPPWCAFRFDKFTDSYAQTSNTEYEGFKYETESTIYKIGLIISFMQILTYYIPGADYMYNFPIDIFIWSFAIYGFINIVKELWLDTACYIIKNLQKLKSSRIASSYSQDKP